MMGCLVEGVVHQRCSRHNRRRARVNHAHGRSSGVDLARRQTSVPRVVNLSATLRDNAQSDKVIR